MREQDLSASPMPHSLGTFLAEQESTAPGRENKKQQFYSISYLYCITQKMPCFFHKIMLEFRLRKYEKNQIFSNENSGFLERKESQIYVFIRLCMG